jgi:hypothetical protein
VNAEHIDRVARGFLSRSACARPAAPSLPRRPGRALSSSADWIDTMHQSRRDGVPVRKAWRGIA